MRAVRSLAALAAVATVAACSGSARTPAAPSPADRPPPPLAQPREGAPAAPVATAPRTPGVPHFTAVERVVLSPEGDAAITRDTSGRLRFWASLDGKAEPLPIPIGSASHFALARGKVARGQRSWTIALVDTAGGAHLLRAYGNGVIERVYDLPPKLNMVDVQVLPGGQRTLFLRSDRVIELRDAGGALLARHDRRGFRPSRIRLAGSSALVALEIEPGTSESSVTVHRLRIVDKPTGAAIRAVDDGYTVTVKSFAVGADQATVSPSAKHFAFLSLDPKSNTWEAVIADLEAREHRAIPLALLPRHQTPALGFVGDTTLIARGGANGSTWLVELGGDTESMRPLPVRPDITNNAPRAFARDVMVAGLGSWLYVYRADTRKALYLGYEQFSPMTAAVSPSGRAVAWGSNNDLFITSLSGERLGERELLRFQSVRHIAFVDEHRLLIAYYTAALELYDWKADKVLATTDGGGSFSAGAYDPESRMFYVIPQHGQVWVTEVSKTGLRGPFVVADGAIRAGFLDGARLWTFDNRNRLRHYTFDELRAGVSNDSAAHRGGIVGINPVNVGRDGRLYGTVYNGGRTHLAVYPAPELPEPDPSQDPKTGPRIDLRNKELAKAPTISGVALSEVAPTGDRIAVVSNNVVFVRGGTDLKVGWSYPFPNGVRSLSWNASGTHLAVATQEGAVVFEASTGKTINTNCGPHFAARETPPANLFPSNVATSVCER